MLGELPGHVKCPDPSIYWSTNYVVLDFETSSFLKGTPTEASNRIVMCSWRSPDGRTHSAFGSEYEQGELVAACEAADFVVAHNAGFELAWLSRCGLDLRRIVSFDTMVAEHVIGGNRFGLHQLGLDAVLSRYGLPAKLSTVGLMLKAGFHTEDIPETWLQLYCERDVEACHDLFLRQRDKLKSLGLESINYQRNLVTPCLADIGLNGMQLDEDEVFRLEKQYEDEYARLTQELQDFSEGANPASAKQMREFIYHKLKFAVPRDFRGEPITTPAGDYSVAANVLERLVARTPKQEKFLHLRGEWGRLNSDLTKYVRKFADCCREDSGLLYGSFNQANTRTHRLSSTGIKHRVQFQNFNRNFKPLFRARNVGWSIGEADGAQLEFRVAAHLGRDRVALHDIVTGTDIHAYTASVIGCSRQDAKAHTFKPLYGGMSGTEAEKRYYVAFKEKYQGVASTQIAWTQEVLANKKLQTEWGMKYYWPDTKMSPSGYITNSTSIYNYPVQAFATAEIIPCALVCAWHRMKDMESFLVNTVHDSLIAEVHPDETELWHEVAKQCLIHDAYDLIQKLYSISLTVPLGAGVMLGPRWADKESKSSEVVYNAPEDLWTDAAKEQGMM